jgi:hypothetical protein
MFCRSEYQSSIFKSLLYIANVRLKQNVDDLAYLVFTKTRKKFCNIGPGFNNTGPGLTSLFHPSAKKLSIF